METNALSFSHSYIIEQDVCFLTLCERNFNRKLAYRFLEDLSQEFYSLYGGRINTATRPYSFIEFDTYIQKAKRTYADSRGNRNLNALNNELQDVQRIMVQNIDDVLQRGAVLSGKMQRFPALVTLVTVTYSAPLLDSESLVV